MRNNGRRVAGADYTVGAAVTAYRLGIEDAIELLVDDRPADALVRLRRAVESPLAATATAAAAEERCECCDLPVTSCGKAAEQRLRDDAAQLRRRLERNGWQAAAWPGTCLLCGDPFAAGAMIVRGRDGYRAECCS